jgi:putative serine protease PepD
MTPLIIEVDGRVLRLDGDRTIRIGRAIEADVVLTAGSVSRQHAVIEVRDGSWVVADAGSNFGTFVDGQRISEHRVTGRVAVTCGPDAPGASLTIYPEPAAPAAISVPSHAPAPVPPPPASPFAPPAPPGSSGPAGPAAPEEAGGTPYAPPPPTGVMASAEPPAPPGAGDPFGQTQIVGVGQGPGHPGHPAATSGPDLLLVAEGREHRFRHPTPITIGRHPDSTVVLTDPAASRAHGRIDPVPGGWVYVNVSSEGTYHDGRRVTGERVEDRMQLRLGHPVAGPEVTVVPILSAAEEEKRLARKRRNRTLRTVGTAAAALVLIAGVVLGAAALLFGGDDEPSAGGDDPTGDGDTLAQLTGDELDTAKASTVLIVGESHLAIDPSYEAAWSGSGSIISEDGLILTNAHVATPEDPAIVDYYQTPPEQVLANPEQLTIAVTDPETGAVEPAYLAEVVASDGELDASVLQIVADLDGNEVDDLDLPAIPVGDSDGVELADPVTVLGFPAIARSDVSAPSETITVTDGKISTILDDVQEFDTTARISGGNSGGMAIDNDAQLIGVPTKIRGDGIGEVSGRLRMINAVNDLIEEAEQAG